MKRVTENSGLAQFSKARPLQAEEAFLAWVNAVLPDAHKPVTSIEDDFQSGEVFADLLEELMPDKIQENPIRIRRPPRSILEKIDNLSTIQTRMLAMDCDVRQMDIHMIAKGGKESKDEVMAVLYRQVITYGASSLRQNGLLKNLNSRLARVQYSGKAPTSLVEALQSPAVIASVVESARPGSIPADMLRTPATPVSPQAHLMALTKSMDAARQILQLPNSVQPAQILENPTNDLASLYFQTILTAAQRVSKGDPDALRLAARNRRLRMGNDSQHLVSQSTMPREKPAVPSEFVQHLENVMRLQRATVARPRAELAPDTPVNVHAQSAQMHSPPVQIAAKPGPVQVNLNPFERDVHTSSSTQLPGPSESSSSRELNGNRNEAVPSQYSTSHATYPAVKNPNVSFPIPEEVHVQPLGHGLYRCLLRLLPPVIKKYQTRKPRDILLCVDVSGSMESNDLSRIQQMMLEIIQDMKSGDRISIVLFNDIAMQAHSFADPADPDQLRSVVAAMDASGGTNFTEALKAAQNQVRQMRPGQDVQKIFFLLTDGFDNEAFLMSNDDAKYLLASASNDATRRFVMDSREKEAVVRAKRLSQIRLEYERLVQIHADLQSVIFGYGDPDSAMLNYMAEVRGHLYMANNNTLNAVLRDVQQNIIGQMDGKIVVQLETGHPQSLLMVYSRDPRIEVLAIEGSLEAGAPLVILNVEAVSVASTYEIGFYMRHPVELGSAPKVYIRTLFDVMNESVSSEFELPLTDMGAGSASLVQNHAIRMSTGNAFARLYREAHGTVLRHGLQATLHNAIQDCMQTPSDPASRMLRDHLLAVDSEIRSVYELDASEIITEDRLRQILLRHGKILLAPQ